MKADGMQIDGTGSLSQDWKVHVCNDQHLYSSSSSSIAACGNVIILRNPW
jgi:hypothetical protein